MRNGYCTSRLIRIDPPAELGLVPEREEVGA